MKILVVSATRFECLLDTDSSQTLNEPMSVKEPFNHLVDLLITGVGAVPTSFALTRFACGYDLIVNIGIAGSYNPIFGVGSVVGVNEDAFGDYGIDDNGQFKPLSDNEFVGNTLFSASRFLKNPWLDSLAKTLNLPQAKGLTLSTVSGSQEAIDKIVKFWNADIETMEGAAVFYVCSQLNIPFVCLRAISNLVEARNKAKWESSKAINNLDRVLRQFIQSID